MIPARYLCLLLFAVMLVVPVLATTTTYNVDSTTDDGYVSIEGGNHTFAALVAHNGDTTSTTAHSVLLNTHAISDYFWSNRRAELLVNTSGLPDDATIDSATFVIKGTDKGNAFTTAPELVLLGIQGDSALANADYQGGIATPNIIAANKSYAALSGSTWNVYTITNLTHISKTGKTKLMLVWGWDLGATTPVWANTAQTIFSYEAATAYMNITYNNVVAPVAAFSGTPTSGTSPQSVTFTDASTNAPSAWNWYYNAGGSDVLFSNSQNPVQSFPAGVYDIKLNASNAAGFDWENKTGYININSAGSTIYYVDATGGDDSYNGTTTASAWKTLSKVDGVTYAAFDTIKFKRGETWTGGITPHYANLTFTDYGAGALPIIDANNATNGLYTEKAYTTVSNLNIINGFDFNVEADGAIYFTASGLTLSNAANDNIILMHTTNAYLSDIDSSAPWVLYPSAETTTLEIADNSVNVTVVNFRGHNSPDTGFSVHAHNAHEFPQDVTIRNSSFYNNAEVGMNFGSGADTATCTNGANQGILLENVSVYNNTNFGVFSGVAGASAPCGIKFSNSTIRTPDVISMRANNITFQKSVMGSAIFTNVTDLNLLSDTLYNTNAANTLWIKGSLTNDAYARNNIFMSNTTGQKIINTSSGTGTAGWDFDYNDYFKVGDAVTDTDWTWGGTAYNWADWKTQTAKDSHSISSNPLFGDPSGGNFSLSAGSPAINTGVNIGFPYNGSAPDMGAYESETGSPPVASFITNVTSGTVPLAVQFTDSSTNTPTGWNWSFGDGVWNNGTNSTIVHIYASAGAFNASLLASNSAGSNTSANTTITASDIPLPVADFTADDVNICNGDFIQFTDTSVTAPTSWLWIFGLGITSTDQNPRVQYTGAGTFSVNLSVTNTSGSDWENKTDYITVINCPPSADFMVPDPTVCIGESVSFVEQSAYEPTEWYWDFGDGNTSAVRFPTNTYGFAGSFNVSLNATNAQGFDWENKTGAVTVSETCNSGFSSDMSPIFAAIAIGGLLPIILLGGVALSAMRGRELNMLEIAGILVVVVIIVVIVAFMILFGGTVEVLTQ